MSALLPLVGYLCGSILFGVLAARRAGVDLREVGSGNVGATNVGRALGKATGRKVLALDALKGLVPTGAAALWLGADHPLTAATGVATVAGHLFPVFFRFRGGKGAATGVGALLGAVPAAGLGAALTFLVLRRYSRRASVGSLAGSVVGAVITVLLHGPTWPTAMAAAVLVLVWIRHADNLRRLVAGEEPPS